MASEADIQAQKRQQARETAGRAAGATRSPLQSVGGSGWASADPTFDDPSAHGPTAPVPSTGMGGLTKGYDPQPERAKRRTFGVSEGDQ